MKGIRAIVIIEIAGRPPEHVTESLKNHIKLIRDYKGVTVMSDSCSEPKKIENSQDMFSCFSEVEIEAESFYRLTDFVFDFMPSSIEIINPSCFEFNMADATSFLNTLAGRLHRYDEIAGVAQIQAKQLAEKLKEVYGQATLKESKDLVVSTNVDSCEDVKKKSKKKKR